MACRGKGDILGRDEVEGVDISVTAKEVDGVDGEGFDLAKELGGFLRWVEGKGRESIRTASRGNWLACSVGVIN